MKNLSQDFERHNDQLMISTIDNNLNISYRLIVIDLIREEEWTYYVFTMVL